MYISICVRALATAGDHNRMHAIGFVSALPPFLPVTVWVHKCYVIMN